MSELSSEVTFVDLAFTPTLELVGMVRQFASDFYAEQRVAEEDISRIAIATYEIVENALKYSLDGLARVRIEYRRRPLGQVLVRAWNRPRLDHLEVLKRSIAEMAVAPDAFAHYLELIRRSSMQPEGSGLGLGRIRAEAEMKVDCSVDGEWICVSAEGSSGGIDVRH